MLALTKIEKLPRGIEGYQGKEQVAVAVTGGRKVLKDDGRPGGVVDRDVFHITYPDEDRTGVKPYHPAYDAFNKAPKEKRKVLYGVLTHIQEEDAFWYERKAQQLPVSYYRNFDWFKQLRSTQQSVSHPKRFPACCGGAKDDHGKVIARRWVGPEAKDFRIIQCPGDECEFSIRTEKTKRPPCSPSLEFLFTLMWKKEDFPTLRPATARYTSKGKQTLSYFIGFFQKINRAIKILGIENPILYGFTFMLSMGENTNPEEKWNWPVITITELMTPMEFFAEQLRQRKELRETSLQIPSVISVSEEMEQRPTIYTMDEPGPLRIGSKNVNETAIEIEPEPEGEKQPVAPNAGISLNGMSKESSKAEKSTTVKAGKAENGENGNTNTKLFPENWATEREKLVRRIGSSWRLVTAKTLGENILLKTKDDKTSVQELYFRLVAAEKEFEKLGAIDEWKSMTFDGDLESIPLTPMKGDDEKTYLAGQVIKLEARYRELKKQKA